MTDQPTLAARQALQRFRRRFPNGLRPRDSRRTRRAAYHDLIAAGCDADTAATMAHYKPNPHRANIMRIRRARARGEPAVLIDVSDPSSTPIA